MGLMAWSAKPYNVEAIGVVLMVGLHIQRAASAARKFLDFSSFYIVARHAPCIFLCAVVWGGPPLPITLPTPRVNGGSKFIPSFPLHNPELVSVLSPIGCRPGRHSRSILSHILSSPSKPFLPRSGVVATHISRVATVAQASVESWRALDGPALETSFSHPSILRNPWRF